MRNSVEITRGYQIGYMLIKELVASFVCLLLGFAIFMNFFNIPFVKYVMGGISVFVYACFLYSAAATLGKFDSKPYTPLNVQYRRPLIWGAIVAVINITFIIAYIINWNLMAQDKIPSVVSVLINAAFYFWNSPYFAFIIKNTGENLPVYVIVLNIIVPVIACLLGYYAGSKKIFVADKVNDFMFEKQDSEE